jgi:hypothetical protein
MHGNSDRLELCPLLQLRIYRSAWRGSALLFAWQVRPTLSRLIKAAEFTLIDRFHVLEEPPILSGDATNWRIK